MTDDPNQPLVLGPLLRYVDETTAAIWVEVARRGTVTARVGEQLFEAPTFTVHGHHYALVEVDGLEPGTSTAYDIWLEDRKVWPPADSKFPASRIRTLEPGRRNRVVFGSCRTSVNLTPVGLMTAASVARRALATSRWASAIASRLGA